MKRNLKPPKPIVRRFVMPLAALVTVIIVSVGTPAQQPVDVFTERVLVNVVNVEVFVTDRSGRHVAGLTKDDFEVFQDGKPVEVTNFYTDTTQDIEESDRTIAEDLEAKDSAVTTPPSTPPPPIPDSQRLYLLVYIDNYNILPSNRQRVLDSLDGFLDGRVAAGDSIMLTTYNRSIEVVQQFTADPELIRAGMEAIRKQRTYRQVQVTQRNQAASSIARALRDPFDDSAESTLNRYIQTARADLQMTTQAIGTSVRSLAGIPGRKAFLYVSDGIQQRPGEQLAEQFGFPTSLNMDESGLFHPIVREANANQVTFYSLDAAVSSTAFGVSATMSDDVSGGDDRVGVEARMQMNLEEPLIGMSLPTGGTAILGTANFDDALETIGDDFDRFYSLGFPTLTPGDGKFHNIEVKIKRPGMRIRHRSGFVDKDLPQQVADRTLSALLVGTTAESNPLDVGIQFARPEAKGSKKNLLPTLIRVPLRDVTLLPQGNTIEGRLRIFLVVQDEQGGVSQIQDTPYPVSLPAVQLEKARQSEIGHLTHLKIRSGMQKIAVGVLDEISGTESFFTQFIQLGNNKDKKDQKDQKKSG